MRKMVLQAAAIYLAGLLFMYHFGLNLVEQVKRDEGFRNMTSALNKTASGLLNQTTHAIMNLPLTALVDEEPVQLFLTDLNNKNEVTIAPNATAFDVLNQTVNIMLDRVLPALQDDELWDKMLEEIMKSKITVHIKDTTDLEDSTVLVPHGSGLNNTTDFENSTALAPIVRSLSNETTLEEFLALVKEASTLDLTEHPEFVTSMVNFLADWKNGTVRGDLLETYAPLIQGLRNGTVIKSFLSNFDNVSNMQDLLSDFNQGAVLDGFQDLAHNATSFRRLVNSLNDGTSLDIILDVFIGITGIGDILGGTGSRLPLGVFYGVYVIRELLIGIILLALRYKWYMFLERILPARRRLVEVELPTPGPASEKQGEKKEPDEEEILERAAAPKQTRRDKLNFWMTLLKWWLQLSIGEVLFNVSSHVVRGLFSFTSLRVILMGVKSVSPSCSLTSPLSLFPKANESIKQHLKLRFLRQFLSLEPWTHLLAFIFVPAHKQIVFLAGADLVATIVFTAVVQQVVAYALSTETVQVMLKEATQHAMGFDIGNLNLTATAVDVVKDEL